MKKKGNEAAGFTLVELVVVMVIVGILASLSVPMYRAYINRSRAQEGVSLAGAVIGAQKVYYTEFGYFKPVSSTGNDSVLGVDARGNTYFKTFAVTTSGTGAAATMVVTVPGADAAKDITVTGTAGATIPTVLDDGLKKD
ncbi:MAG: prepilin-type N-terminal cleavage/methylation domain-containing protein [Elusimicrobia bacterium]|nr:prepilin-type N-terminal cleavage/methylation domain-containing protein [Elusimicrobiota bacterium]